jgi:hypothetical protein
MAAPDPLPTCFRCRAGLVLDVPVTRSATCAACGAWVRVCRNCAFYAPGAHNDCREPSAERVVEKERANFCELFQLATRGGAPAGGAAGGAREALDALFRKA